MSDTTERFLQTELSKIEADPERLLQKLHARFEPWRDLVNNYQCAVGLYEHYYEFWSGHETADKRKGG